MMKSQTNTEKILEMSRQRPEYKEITHNSSNNTDVSLDT